MSATSSEPRIDAASLQLALHSVEPAALLVEPRILRRVIKQDRRVAGFGLQVPHRHCYTIQRDRLLVIVERQELNLSPAAELPKKVILLARPTEGEFLETAPGAEVLHAYWRMLFHARVHLALEQLVASGGLDAAIVFQRRRLIGATEFDEIRSVLHKDDMLLPPGDDLETYVEFIAVYLELRYFAPQELTAYFPAVRDWKLIDQLISRDVEHESIYRETRLPGAPIQSRGLRALTDTQE